MSADPLPQLRRLCLALPETVERTSHHHPAWFVRGKRAFVLYTSDFPGGHRVIRCAAPPGAQQAMVATEPERFFVPPYVGHRGWLGVYLDAPVDWDEVAGIVEDAYRTVAPKRLVAALDAAAGDGEAAASDGGDAPD